MRKKTNWNIGWTFVKKAKDFLEAMKVQGEEIDLPHTWNAKDGQDGGNDYYRGTCYYVKKFQKPDTEEGGENWLEFQGVSATADIYLNGQQIGHHEGGYSVFRVRLPEALPQENVLVVAADNSANRKVYPQKADFTFYGGIHRGVFLLTVPKSHFDLSYFGSDGIKVTAEIRGRDASVLIEAWAVGNPGKVVLGIDGTGETEASFENGCYQARFDIKEARLWNGKKDPFLYTARARIYQEGNLADEVSVRFGCRRFSFDTEKGFMLNGESYPLHGVSRHQDWKDVGNALTPEMHRKDMELIREIGANTIRLAHYQHDPYFYELCDEAGMLVWTEIPYISEHMPEADGNTMSQMRELVVQNYNHPCVLCWGLSNEITVAGEGPDLIENHKRLNSLVHELDRTRPTAMAHVFMLDTDDELAGLSDIASYNLYYGWYVGELEDNERWFDDFHEKYPERVIGLSEYGADANPAFQSADPQRSDYSEQYQCLYHEHMLEMFEQRPYIWATHVWNMFDFGADGREEGGERGLNQKGLITIDRKVKKDAFYLYKAYWSDDPFVHICGQRYQNRAEAVTSVKVYSNQKHVALYDNGQLIAEKDGNRIFEFQVSINGQHLLEAYAGDMRHSISVRRVKDPDRSYVLESGSIHNWFEEPGMEIREGYYSIKDTIGDICRDPQGKILIDELLETARAKRGDVAKNVKKNDSMQRMMERRSLESLIKQAAGAITKNMVVELNQALCRIPRQKGE